MEEITNENKILDYILKYFEILDKNFDEKNKKKLNNNDLKVILNDLSSLFNKLYELNPNKCSKLSTKRYIPLLDLMIKIDRDNGNYYLTQLKEAYRISARTSLESYMIYREWDDKDKFYTPRYDIMQGYVHYLEEITTNPHFQLLIANMPSGYGKLIANDVPVLTKNGWKKHGDLKVGDYVLGKYGEYVRVNIVHPKRLATVKVIFEDGEEILCHNQHEWNVYDIEEHKEKTRVETNYIIKHIHTKNGKNRFYIPICIPVIGEEKELAVEPYTYGLWLGTGNKKLEKYILDSYLTSSIKQRLKLLAGIIDATGYLNKNKKRYIICVSGDKLKDDIISLISTFHWRVSVTKVKRHINSTKIVDKKYKYYINFNPTMYIPCKLHKKQLHKFSKQRKIGISKIEKIPLTEGNCITVDGGLYLVGKTLKLTHNTFPEKISEAWNFGVDPTGTVLSLCSNEDVVTGGSRVVLDEMKSEWFGEVFPEMKWDEGDKSYFLKETSANWKLKQCRLVSSYYAKTVQSNVVGVRASQRIHIDDLYADYKEAMSQQLNEYYLNKYLTVWSKRFVQNLIPKVVVTGTLWASGDFIALLIRLMKKRHKFKRHPKYKYTYISEDETIAIIQVPALDYETGLSTCPELRTTKELYIEKSTMDEYLWETNFQQRPTDPEALFFSYNRLRTYNGIPETEFDGTYAVIDANRKSGKDFFAMPIFVKVKNESQYEYYLKDCIFTKVATKDLYQEICDKIIEHHIIELVIESNVTSELKSNIDKILKANGIYYCIIREKYNCENKQVRIELEKGNIIRQLVFPKQEIIGLQSEMGKFMNNLTLYNSNGNNVNDDAPDSCAMFCHEIIDGGSKPQRVKPIWRLF